MHLLVQAMKQYKRPYEQGDLLCLELSHLLPIQCCQISVKTAMNGHTGKSMTAKIKRKIVIAPFQSKSERKEFHVFQLLRKSRWSYNSFLLTRNRTIHIIIDYGNSLLTIQVTLNLWYTRTGSCRSKLCDYIYRGEDQSQIE